MYKDTNSHEIRIGTQKINEDDVEEEHRAARICFSTEQVYAYDIEPNVVGDAEISKYKRRFDLDSDLVQLQIKPRGTPCQGWWRFTGQC